MRVVAVSVDDVPTLRRFSAQQKLAFPLLSDPEGRVAALYGALRAGQALRLWFVVDELGIVRDANADFALSSYGPALFERIRALRR